MKPLRVAVGLSLAVLATLALGALHIPAPPDFFLLVVADMARGGAAVPAMLAGLPAGLLQDGLFGPGRLLGLHAFSKILVGYLLATVGARTVVEKPVAVGGLLTGAVLVEAASCQGAPRQRGCSAACFTRRRACPGNSGARRAGA